MSTNVTANGRSILHKGHGMTHVCAVPDVCKTPTPGGPVPIPYINVAMDSDLTQGAKSVKIEGNPVANVSSKIATSMGDEPGTVGGIISSRVKGTMTWKMASLDVKAEGKSVVRFLDTAFHNGNSFNTSFINVGAPQIAYGDDTPCLECGQPYEKHRVDETPDSRNGAGALVRRMNEILEEQDELITNAMMARANMKLWRQNPARRYAPPGAVVEQEAAHNAANNALEGQFLLRFNDSSGSYTQGYMIGICYCQCGARAVAACSGEETPGFRRAVNDCGLELAEQMPALSARQARAVRAARGEQGVWCCAGPKLVNAMNGHKPRTMTEIWYYPTITVLASITYRDRSAKPPVDRPVTRVVNSYRPVTIQPLTIDGEVVNEPRTFDSGDSVPSCNICRVNLPEMLCDVDELCP